ncbi:Phd_YefM (plasmid) [Variovorax sp. SRS16]|uniref:type II toxin-antitoxin system Phd/YefM family antitoxin n=1 Tax=Variovorax sp. SRS16 TaxID=282217 RepID=UPI001319164B|nr:type II toxin-antitoxin system Phd/YefM family antitoxin [Variovorax sp. SRS16]VTU45591.1 Phd_YefM [Variovorax sp. SRS16]
MQITTLSGQEFNRDSSGARRAAQNGPVFITDRGRPAHVLLAIEEYQRLAGPRASIAELLAMPGGEDLEFEAPRFEPVFPPADLS